VVLGVELGIVGLLLYVSIQIVSIWTALRLFRHEAGVTQMLLLIAAVSRIGLAIAGLTAHIEIYFFQAFVSWWLIGFASQTRSASIQPFSCASALTQARPS
jgi:hypothetical protein